MCSQTNTSVALVLKNNSRSVPSPCFTCKTFYFNYVMTALWVPVGDILKGDRQPQGPRGGGHEPAPMFLHCTRDC